MNQSNVGERWREEFRSKRPQTDNKLLAIKYEGAQSEEYFFGYKYIQDGDIHEVTDWGNIEKFIQSLLSAQLDEVEKWAVDNHAHHEFADEEVPKGQYGCAEKDSPYVNSKALVKFLQRKRRVI